MPDERAWTLIGDTRRPDGRLSDYPQIKVMHPGRGPFVGHDAQIEVVPKSALDRYAKALRDIELLNHRYGTTLGQAVRIAEAALADAPPPVPAEGLRGRRGLGQRRQLMGPNPSTHPHGQIGPPPRMTPGGERIAQPPLGAALDTTTAERDRAERERAEAIGERNKAEEDYDRLQATVDGVLGRIDAALAFALERHGVPPDAGAEIMADVKAGRTS